MKNDYVAQVGENKFTNLKDAVNACLEGQNNTIAILKSFIMTESEKVTIEANKNIILDLNGQTMTIFCNTGAIKNNGTLNITDTTADTTGRILSNGNRVIENTGMLTIANGTIKQNKPGTSQIPINIIQNTGELSINGGTITSTNADINAISNEEKGTITINGGTLGTSGSTGTGIINNNSTNKVTITDGTINGAIYNLNSGMVEVRGGTIEDGIYNSNVGSIVITNGTIKRRLYWNIKF